MSVPDTSYDDDNLLPFMTGNKYWITKPMQRSDIMVLTLAGRSLSGGGGFGEV